MKYLMALFGLVSSSVFASSLTVSPFVTNEFQPSKGEVFEIPFILDQAAKVTVDVYTPDGELIRTLAADSALEAGQQVIQWDGKDSEGRVVPDEAYQAVLSASFKDGTKETVDHRATGGEVLENLAIKRTDSQDFTFTLSNPARVLSRVGIKGGPLLRTLNGWDIKNAGEVLVKWDGYDKDKVINIKSRSDWALMVRAYALPDNAIIVSGQPSASYRAYRSTLNQPSNDNAKAEKVVYERDGKAIERHYSFPKDLEVTPEVQAKFIDQAINDDGVAEVTCPCYITVDMNEQDKIQLQNSFYEIAFFLDGEFISEQEQGYVPMKWKWSPSSSVIDDQEHVLVINVSGLRGEVGVKSIPFRFEQTQ
jgi:hypothetical protein